MNHATPEMRCGVRFVIHTARGVKPGMLFGRLEVLGEPFYVRTGRESKPHVVCRCTCGNTCCVRSAALRKGGTLSCGCLHADVTRAVFTKHGAADSLLHQVWKGMKSRCYNTRARAYRWYGARGIAVCDEWLEDYAAFERWANQAGYRAGLTIDRIDNDRGYEPSNCRWVPQSEQARNRKNTRKLVAFGVEKLLRDWPMDSRCVVNYHTLKTRLAAGWPAEEALTRPADLGNKTKRKESTP